MQTTGVCPLLHGLFVAQLPRSDSFGSISTADSLKALGDLAQKVLSEVHTGDVCVAGQYCLTCTRTHLKGLLMS